MTAIIRSSRLTNSCKTTHEKKKPLLQIRRKPAPILPDVPLEVLISFVHFSLSLSFDDDLHFFFPSPLIHLLQGRLLEWFSLLGMYLYTTHARFKKNPS